MILRSFSGLALVLLTSTVFAQNMDYGLAGVIACTSLAEDLPVGVKRVNVIIADATAKTVSMSIQSKNGYPVYQKSSLIVNIDNPMAPPPPPPAQISPIDSLGANPVAPAPEFTLEKPVKPAKLSKKDKKKQAKVEPVKVSKVITYELQRVVRGADPIAAKLLVDSEKNSATFMLGSDATQSDTYPLCRAFASEDYGAIYAWIKNQL